MLFNEKIVAELVRDLLSGDEDAQARACQHIRDLCRNNEHYCDAFVAGGAIAPLCGLLDDVGKQASVLAAQALSYLAQQEEWRLQMRDAGGVDNLAELLRRDDAVSEASLEAVLTALQLFAADPKLRGGLAESGAMQAVVKLLSRDHCEEVVCAAVTLLHMLAFDAEQQLRIRACGGLGVLVKKAANPATERAVVCAALQAITACVAGCGESQDEVRFLGGLSALLSQLQLQPYDDTTAAAADALRALCAGSEANKSAVRKEWGLPLLVQLIGPSAPAPVAERGLDCLRILTASNEENKSALMGCGSALPYLVGLLDGERAGQQAVLMERAAAVLSNLTTSTGLYTALREAGAVQKLVRLLDAGKDSKLTEVSVSALANLMQDEHSRKAMRLAGGVPPLIQLMIDSPTRQVQQSAEVTLVRLGVTDVERNAILETLRYAEARHAQAARVSLTLTVEESGHALADGTRVIGPKPLMRYTPEDVCTLLSNLALPDTAPAAALGVTGGELLEMSAAEACEGLGWTKLQAKKLLAVQRAYALWGRVCAVPGVGEASFLELQKWLEGLGVAPTDVLALLAGFKDACLTPEGGTVTFQDWARSYYWIIHSIHALGHDAGDAAASAAAGAAAGEKAGCVDAPVKVLANGCAHDGRADE